MTPEEFRELVEEYALASREGEGWFMDRDPDEILAEIMEAFKKGPSE